MPLSRGRLVTLATSWTMLVLIVGVAVFSQVRGLSLSLASASSSSSPVPTNTTAPPQANATQLVSACQAACLVDACQQSPVTGVVSACTSCGGARQLTPTGLCVDASQCTAWPWCTTTEALQARQLHNALVQAKIDLAGNTTAALPLDFNITQATEPWSLLSPHFSAAEATSLLDIYLAARRALPYNTGPTGWFDDQGGWWTTRLDAYRASLQPEYAAYVTPWKTRLCAAHWQASTTSATVCLVPPPA